MLSTPVKPREPASQPTLRRTRAKGEPRGLAGSSAVGLDGMDLNPAPDQAAESPGLDRLRAAGKAVRIWALLGPHAGDNNQVLALAEALGFPFEAKPLRYSAMRHLRPRLLGASLASLTEQSRRSIEGEPPDLAISTGIRSVPVVRALRKRSGGRMKAVHLGDPRVPPKLFDLVVPTPEYPVFDDPSAMPVPLALTRERSSPSPEVRAELEDRLPAPRMAVLIGGDTLFWRLRTEDVLAAIDAAEREANAAGGSLVAVTSARTPERLVEAVRHRLEASPVAHALLEPGGEFDYGAVLASADRIRVSADSVAMVSDAASVGRLAGLVPLKPSAAGGLYLWALGRLAPSLRMRPRDLRRFWSELERMGKAELSAAAAAKRKAAVVAAVRSLLA